MRSSIFAASCLVLCLGASSAKATVSVAIDLSHQRMHVVSSRGDYDWPISSARSGFYTPGGSFAPTHLERMHYSKKYHMSPMPYSIFFRGGFAIHGTYSVGELGRPASHGCVRLSPGNAAALYRMVQTEGARISISGTPPASRPFARSRNVSRPYEARRLAGPRTAARALARAAGRFTALQGYAYTYGYQPYAYGARPPESYTKDYVYTAQPSSGGYDGQ